MSQFRKPDADAIADMAVENFTEMRDKVADPRFLLEKQVERILQREFPDKYVSRYSLVTFSRAPYRKALLAGQAHAGLLRKLCEGIEKPEQVDLCLARTLIEKL
jgi:kynurenine 3-monooxygenase